MVASDFADVDGDSDLDMVVIGTNGFQDFSELLLNDGSGNFSIDTGAFLNHGYFDGDLKFGDIDSDGDEDLIFSGHEFNFSSPGSITSSIYINDGMGGFTKSSMSPFLGYVNGTLDLIDIDNDGDLDAILTGDHHAFQYDGMIYTNDGSGNFSLKSDSTLKGVAYGATSFADVEGDGDVDIMICGAVYGNVSPPLGHFRIYLNDSLGNFTEDTANSFPDFHGGSIDFADIDGDGDEDVYLHGEIRHANPRAFYLNDGNGKFSLLNWGKLDKVTGGQAKFFDMDSDSTQDLLITGIMEDDDQRPIAKLYRNISCPDVVVADTVNDACQNYFWKRSCDLYDSSGTYEHIISNHFGCDTTAILYLQVTTLNSGVYQTGFKLYSLDTGAQHQWLDCDSSFSLISGATSSSFQPSYDGRYAVVASRNNCSDTSICKSILGIGLTTFSIQNHVLIFPNPTTGNLNIDFGSNFEGVRFTIQVRNSIGQLTDYQTCIGKQALDLQLNGSQGLYFIQISDSEGHYQQFRVIKN